MSSVVTGTEKKTVRARPGGANGANGHRKNGSRGGGGGNRGGGNGGDEGGKRDGRDRKFSPVIYRIGIWMAIAVIMAMFAALTLIYVLRSQYSGWRPLQLPRVLWLSTAFILASSLTIEVANRFLKRGDEKAYRNWLVATLLLGGGFIAAQIAAWQQLRAQGVFLASNPHSGFFYLLTGAHALHLFGGIAAVSYLLWRFVRPRATDAHFAARRQAASSASALYWHFMDALWIYLFALLLIWK